MNGVRSRSEATLIFEFYKGSQKAGFPIVEASKGLVETADRIATRIH
jgi:hypothetical protein